MNLARSVSLLLIVVSLSFTGCVMRAGEAISYALDASALSPRPTTASDHTSAGYWEAWAEAASH